MHDPTTLAVYDSQSPAYHRAFQVFLDHTDQKDKARAWLDRLVASLPARGTFIDAGAGNGKVTAWYIPQFQRTLAYEPNDSLRQELREHCPGIEVFGDMILAAQPPVPGDFVLCSHVFYYIDVTTWAAHLEQLASWLAPAGVLVVALQNHETDCMKMLEHFFGKRFDLAGLARQFEAAQGTRFTTTLETVPARIETADLETAYIIAEFMLNLLHISQPPTRRAVEDYVRQHFAVAGGGYRFSCNQDFLQVRRR